MLGCKRVSMLLMWQWLLLMWQWLLLMWQWLLPMWQWLLLMWQWLLLIWQADLGRGCEEAARFAIFKEDTLVW
jgi:hypothetical protein